MTTKKTVTTTARKVSVKKAATSPSVAVKPENSAASERVAKKAKKEHKVKIVRDSFTMPQSEYQKIAEIKEACLEAGLQVKKSEVLRAGLKALAGMNAARLKHVLAGLEKIKTGRPKKH